MKKIYQIPTVAIVRVSPCQMIATSLGTSETPAVNGVMLSKGGGFWSDDEEEDYYDEEQLPQVKKRKHLVSQDT